MVFKLGKEIRVEVVFLLVLTAFVAGAHLLCSCSRKSVKEGFKVAKDAALDYMVCEGVPGDTWGGCDKDKIRPRKHTGEKYSTGEKGDTDLESTLVFANNQFRPECCPTEVSSYGGCACISEEQIEFINQRGGNRTMPTNF